jgi:phage-related protein
MKELRFVGTSLDDLSRFPSEAKRAAGFELWQVQNGLEPSDWKPMTMSGSECARFGFASTERGG